MRIFGMVYKTIAILILDWFDVLRKSNVNVDEKIIRPSFDPNDVITRYDG